MMTQPVPRVTKSDVERVVHRDFPADRVAEVFALLKAYEEREPHRVRLAALKLAGGSIERLRYHIEIAKSDYRDVLAPAEYPGYNQRPFDIPELPLDEQRCIIEADWRQYQDWLKG